MEGLLPAASVTATGLEALEATFDCWETDKPETETLAAGKSRLFTAVATVVGESVVVLKRL